MSGVTFSKPPQQRNQEKVSKGSRAGHVFRRAIPDLSVSDNKHEIDTMTSYERNNENLDIDPALILLGLGYATMLCVAVGWAATRVI